MSLLSIRKFPDPVLRKPAVPVERIDRRIRSFVDSLIKTMRNQPGGIGIAATQVGSLKQIAIVDVSLKVPNAGLVILINPVIVTFEDEEVFREGCMSLPDYTANVKRARRITVKYQDIELKSCEIITSGLEARCIQHEIDHLHGKLFLDRVASVKSDVFPRKRYL